MFPDFSQTLSKDRHFLQSAFKNPNKYGGLSKVEEKYRKSHEIFLKRLAALPKPEFDNTLPVHEKLDEIKKTVAEHQVTIICGETGSGKTTQLPKICLELGRGVAGLIGHTQPRRLAARSVAERIAEELKSEIGSAVGYKVRFTDHTSRDACVKLMTDGILLAETQTDRYLAAYDTIIIDEAHERSLNIDFLLGYLKQLLPRRPDLKVIITSATICAATTKSFPCSHACRTPSSTKSSTLQARNAASYWQPTSPKPRLPCRASNTSSTPASRASNAIPHGQRWSSFMSKKSLKPPPANAPAAADASPQACVSDCFQKKISTAAPNLPTQKSSAATSPPSSCAWHR